MTRAKTLIRKTLALAPVALIAVNVQAYAGATRIKGVVELFTSQGCSSCPPADKVLSGLAKREDVIALGYHVDYWDYLGWKDTLGSPDNTERQQAYRRSLRSSSVYTPQAVINGATHVVGSDGAAIEGALNQPLAIELSIEKMQGSVKINVPKADIGGRKVHAVMVRYGVDENVSVQRGENHGQTIKYANPVTGIQTLGMWHGEPATFELPDDAIFGSKGAGCAILLQSVGADGTPGEILGAAEIDSW
jgi:hypothetical protein